MLDQYIVNSDLDLHLRDARHAHQLFTEYGHAFAPKTKFLFHVAFQLTSEVSKSNLINTEKHQKRIGVLARSADLPKFSATVDVKNQYNRKKRVQTRIDYDEVSINFYDDNVGVTRTMLEEYYKFYVKDPSQPLNGSAFGKRDKYINDNTYPTYGLNNGKHTSFFDSITIYQLSRKEWFSYTLVNPLLTSWSHDQVDSNDNSGIMENFITVGYESVVYDNGIIGEESEPSGFGDGETGYDVVPSPLEINPNASVPRGPEIIDPYQTSRTRPQRFSNGSTNSSNQERRNPSSVIDSVLKNTMVPDMENVSVSEVYDDFRGNPRDLLDNVVNNPEVKNSLVSKAINTNEVSGTMDDYINGSEDTKSRIENEVIEKLPSSSKLQNVAKRLLDL